MTLQEIVNRIEIEMLAENIPPETVDRVTNRLVYGHPDGLNAKIDLSPMLDSETEADKRSENLRDWTPKQWDEWASYKPEPPQKEEWTPGWPPQDSDDMR
jgi:hypothetical protein